MSRTDLCFLKAVEAEKSGIRPDIRCPDPAYLVSGRITKIPIRCIPNRDPLILASSQGDLSNSVWGCQVLTFLGCKRRT